MRAFPAMLISLLVAIVSSSCTADSATVPNEPWPVVTLSIEPTSAVVPVGTTIQLSATARDSGGALFSGLPITWTTSNGSIATVGLGEIVNGMAAGSVNGMAAGSVEIIATVEGKSDTAAITVTSILAPPVQPPALPSLRLLAAARGFAMGTAANIWPLRADSQYGQVLATQYNSIVPEIEMHFKYIHPGPSQYDFSGADAWVAFAQANGMAMHGIDLAWHQSLPAWITEGTFTKAQWLAILKDHIESIVGRYRGKIASWDVVNEVMLDNGTSVWNTFWFQRIGPEHVDSAFVWAHRADPAAKLYFNDNRAEELNAKSDAILSFVKALRARGIPIDGVGFQAHFTPTLPKASDIRANFARFANAGFDIRVSEMDVQVADSAGSAGLVTQAAIYHDVLDACLLLTRCTGFTTWGFTDRYSWIDSPTWGTPGVGRALPFDSTYQAKPAFDSLAVRLRQP